MDNFYRDSQDFAYKGFLIVVHDYHRNAQFRVNADYKGDGEFTRILYQGESVEDCMAWAEAHEGCKWWMGTKGVA